MSIFVHYYEKFRLVLTPSANIIEVYEFGKWRPRRIINEAQTSRLWNHNEDEIKHWENELELTDE